MLTTSRIAVSTARGMRPSLFLPMQLRTPPSLARRWNSNNTSTPTSAASQAEAATPALPQAHPIPAVEGPTNAGNVSHAAGPTIDRATAAAALAAGKVAAEEARRKRKRKTLRWVGAFAACTFLLPFALHAWNTYTGNQHYTGSQPFTPAQRMRGPYLNSSTRDIGPDPNYAPKWGIQPVEPREKRRKQQEQSEAQ